MRISDWSSDVCSSDLGEAGGVGVRNADARPEEAHIDVDLCNRGDGGARVAAGRLLLDGDGGGETLDMLDIGLLHHLQKLARISGEGFNIAPLPLRIDGVEGKRTFPRTGKAGDDDQLVAGQVDIDALQIVLARAAHGAIDRKSTRLNSSH